MTRPTIAAALTLAIAALAEAANIVTPPIARSSGANARCDVFNAGREERTLFIAVFDADGDLIATSTNPVRIAPGTIASAFNPGAVLTGPVRCEVGGAFVAGAVEPLKGSPKTLLTTLCALDQGDDCVAAVSVP